MDLLLISATRLEAEPLHAAAAWEELETPWGQLYRSQLSGQTVLLAQLGVGKVNTAAGLALLVDRYTPSRVIQFGIGGAYLGSGLSVGQAAIAAREIHLDSGVQEADGWHGLNELGFPLLHKEQPVYNLIPTDQRLSHALVDATGLPLVTFGTSETVTGDFALAQVLHERFDVAIESMEGAAAAQVCLALGVSFAELRGISNLVGERDKRAWNIPAAVQVAGQAVLRFIRAA
jgi:futalosine hydrolase